MEKNYTLLSLEQKRKKGKTDKQIRLYFNEKKLLVFIEETKMILEYNMTIYDLGNNGTKIYNTITIIPPLSNTFIKDIFVSKNAVYCLSC